MKNIFKFTLALAVAALVTSAKGNLFTFDELTESPPGLQIPDGYAGLTWGNFWELDGTAINAYYGVSASGYANGVISPNNVAYNYNGLTATASSATPFNVISGYFTGAFNNNLSLTVSGYNGATLLYSQTYTLNATGPSFISMNMNNVTEIDFSSFGGYNAGLNYGSGTQFVLDNLTITSAPEPTTWALAFMAGIFVYPIIRNRSTVQKSSK